MKLAIVSFTERGGQLNRSVSDSLSRNGYDCEGYSVETYAKGCGLLPLKEGLSQWTGRMFGEKDGMLFIGATGIAVRSIAPYIKDKGKDPAIVVMDEKGIFVISLMSGHLGGANELTGVLANLTGAIPVITTATDINGKFAVDLFARKNGMYISDRRLAKEVSARVLDEETIGFYSDFPVLGEIPGELAVWNPGEVFEGDLGICVSLNEGKQPYKKTLRLIPRIVTLGIGCRRDVFWEKIEERVELVLREQKISIHGIKQIASIDLKKEEPGLLEFAKRHGLEFVTFSQEELGKVPGDFSCSQFVESVTGVDNVCERSAVLASGMGRLIQKKTAGDGVTIALAVEKWSVDFE